MENLLTGCLGIVVAILLWIVWVIVFGLLFAIPTMLLWDWLMPTLFGLKTITLFQAWGLNVLCGLLFKSQGHGSVKSK